MPVKRTWALLAFAITVYPWSVRAQDADGRFAQPLGLQTAPIDGWHGPDTGVVAPDRGDQGADDPEAAEPIDLAAVPEEDLGCTVEEIDGVVKECCRQTGPYGPYSNCTTFSRNAHQICDREGINCRTVSIACPGSGHRMIMVLLDDGLWHLVEPQDDLSGDPTRGPGFSDPSSPSPEAICASRGVPLRPDGTCPCSVTTVSTEPLPDNTNPITSCALDPSMKPQPYEDPQRVMFSCLRCCRNKVQPPMRWPDRVTSQWWSSCRDACRAHHAPAGFPGAADTPTVSLGRQCVRDATVMSFQSRLLQCKDCCVQGRPPEGTLASCFAVCNGEFGG